jgi:oligosaccharide 4-alpha-D-glucosyltransferase
MRPHSDQVVAPEPYTYPEPYRSIVRRYAHLRYELLPYLYTLAAQNTLTGAPLTRAMDYGGTEKLPVSFADSVAGGDWGQPTPQPVLSFSPPTASPLAPANDQYLLGPSLLVAPINQPGQRRRNVQLPATPGGWVDFETGQTLPADGQMVGLPAPLGHIPLLVRAGAFVPMTAYRASTAAFRADTLLVRYIPDLQTPTSTFSVYEDDGHSAQALAQKQYATIQLTGRYTARQTTISAQVTGTYPGAPAQRLVQLRVARVAAAPTAVLLGGQPLSAAAWQFDAAQHELRVQFPLVKSATLTLVGLRLRTTLAAQLDPETLTLTAPDSRTFSDAATLHYTRHVATNMPEVLRIHNGCGQVVRELPTTTAIGAQTLRWDGRDAQGRPVPPGVYMADLAGQHQQLLRLSGGQ